MKFPRYSNFTFILIMIVMLMGSSSQLLSVSTGQNTVLVEEINNISIPQEYPLEYNSIADTKSPIGLDQVIPGAIEIPLQNFTNIYRGNTSAQFGTDLQEQVFYIQANASSQLELNVTLAAINSDLEGVLYWVDIFDQDFNSIAFAESNPFETPNIQRLPFRAEYDGLYYISIFVAEGFDLDPIISLSLVMFPPGQIQVGEKQRAVLNSNGYERIIDIMDYFQDVGYYNESFHVQVDTLQGDSQNFVKGMSTAIYGLSRSGIFRGASAAELGFQEAQAVAP
ncbi:MAG: hypothetical protein ACW99Q_18040, partial [Candidatus Kariarchaeaceae archaeon]